LLGWRFDTRAPLDRVAASGDGSAPITGHYRIGAHRVNRGERIGRNEIEAELAAMPVRR
jgi:hypothetical protein